MFNPVGKASIDIPCPLVSPVKITSNGVAKLLMNLKAGKAPGPDGLKKEHLTIDVDMVARALELLFQYSLDTGEIPSIWRSANVVPVHKKGDKLSPSNYRPVSLTCICCKILEHIIISNIGVDFDEVLHDHQHGFRQGMSCTTQLATVTHDIMSKVDAGQEVHAVVLDFAKAFDKVTHNILIEKLASYHIEPTVIRWIGSFLEDRTQQVVIDGRTSSPLPVTSGVPQGSVLGPALFLFFINDIFRATKTATLRLFADDALLYMTIRQPHDAAIFQSEINQLDDWATRNGMAFNSNKCQVVRFSVGKAATNPMVYKLRGHTLNNTDQFKYLGVTITNKFKWDAHVNEITNKGLQRLGMLRRVLYRAPIKVKRTAYLSLCRPIIEYAGEVWDPHTKKLIDQLEMVQRRAVRFIYNIKGVASITSYREKLCLDTLEDRRRNARISLLHHLLESGLHSSLAAHFDRLVHQNHSHMTRSASQSKPSALSASHDFLHFSFIHRTSRDLRLL